MTMDETITIIRIVIANSEGATESEFVVHGVAPPIDLDDMIESALELQKFEQCEVCGEFHHADDLLKAQSSGIVACQSCVGTRRDDASIEPCDEPCRQDGLRGQVAASGDDKPRVQLTGEDGNAFAVIGACKKAAKKAGWPTQRWLDVREKMMSGDYDHLLGTAMEHFDVH